MLNRMYPVDPFVQETYTNYIWAERACSTDHEYGKKIRKFLQLWKFKGLKFPEFEKNRIHPNAEETSP